MRQIISGFRRERANKNGLHRSTVFFFTAAAWAPVQLAAILLCVSELCFPVTAQENDENTPTESPETLYNSEGEEQKAYVG